MSTALRSVGLLDVLSSTPAGSSRRAPWFHARLHRVATTPDENTQAIFNQGNEVGKLAKTLYPDGTEIDWNEGHNAGIARTAQLLAAGKPIFEAGFQHGRTHARADILKPADRGRWDLIEVKSSGEVKEEHLHDVAFQKHVFEAAGSRIGRCFVMHVDKTYVRRGEVNANKLLNPADVTAEIKPLTEDIPSEVRRLLSIMAKPRPPKPEIGSQCKGCDLFDECWPSLPERNVLCLNRDGEKAHDLMNQGILSIADIPDDVSFSEKQEIQVDCERTGEPHVASRKIRAFLDQLKYPLHFLDFETFMVAMPPYEELSPWEQISFQYSLHVVDSPGARTRHYSFLADGSTDPRPEALATLKARIGRTGSVIAYNAPFEVRVLDPCASHFPGYRRWVESVRPRFVDMASPFRNFHYYHPDQNGSASLKAVLPALTGKSYEGLEIADGQEAGLRFREMAFGNVDNARKKVIRKALEIYCRQDPEGMLEIVKALRRISR